jgi:hypothetical protein
MNNYQLFNKEPAYYELIWYLTLRVGKRLKNILEQSAGEENV